MNNLIFIGLGLYNGRDISLKGVEALKDVKYIFAEFFTAKMIDGTIKYIESQIDNKITILTRDQVEDGKIILSKAKEASVAFLCQGDPFTATTHVELLIQAKEQDIETHVIHGTSVATAVPGLLGLQFYKFGRTTTLAYPEGDYFPESPYDVIHENLKRDLHTLVLLDVHGKEKRYMTANEGIELLLKINSKRNDDVYTKNTLTCVVSQAGSDYPIIVANEAGKLLTHNFGDPLHSLVIPGKLHFKEAEALRILADAPKNLLEI
jgi:diphthine synthase